MTNFSFDDVEDYFEIDVNVRVSHAAGRNNGDVADIFGRHALLDGSWAT